MVPDQPVRGIPFRLEPPAPGIRITGPVFLATTVMRTAAQGIRVIGSPVRPVTPVYLHGHSYVAVTGCVVITAGNGPIFLDHYIGPHHFE